VPCQNDTCVFSILDSRAGQRYRGDVLAALPDMPVTDFLVQLTGRFRVFIVIIKEPFSITPIYRHISAKLSMVGKYLCVSIVFIKL
jgi:hypothetical protein